MRQLRLVALRTFPPAGRCERIVRPPLGGARLGVTPFRVRHRVQFLSTTQTGRATHVPASPGRRLCLSLFAVGAQSLKRRQSRITPARIARAALDVQIGATHRTQPATFVATERLHRHCQL